MTDIKDISYNDIKEFLTLNNIEISNKDDDYTKAFTLMKKPNITVEPSSIIEWMMAYNLKIKNVKFPDYSITDLINLLIIERNKLSKKIGMISSNITNITSILKYLNKIHLKIGNLKVSNNENIYNIFPKEIWIKILLDLNCKDIDDIINNSIQIKNLIIEENIKEKIKMRGFPRSNGHCVAIDVSKFIYEFDHLSDQNLQREQLLKESFDYVLDELYKSNYNLIRGDLICFEGLNSYRNNGVHIFDGCKIVDLLYDIDDYGSLPEEFTVINNEVPIKYWEYTDDNRGIDHNNLVWFNHISVQQECINNITDIDDELFTTFKYNNKIYKIYAYRTEFDDERIY